MSITKGHELSITAPDSQAFRAQLIFNAILGGRNLEATELLILAARETLDTHHSWAERAAELSQWCADQCSTQRKLLLAALLDLFGQRQGATAIDINAAVYLANLHLDRGHSAARAMAEGRLLLKAAIQPSSAPRLAQASSGR